MYANENRVRSGHIKGSVSMFAECGGQRVRIKKPIFFYLFFSINSPVKWIHFIIYLCHHKKWFLFIFIFNIKTAHFTLFLSEISFLPTALLLISTQIALCFKIRFRGVKVLWTLRAVVFTDKWAFSTPILRWPWSCQDDRAVFKKKFCILPPFLGVVFSLVAYRWAQIFELFV